MLYLKTYEGGMFLALSSSNCREFELMIECTQRLLFLVSRVDVSQFHYMSSFIVTPNQWWNSGL